MFTRKKMFMIFFFPCNKSKRKNAYEEMMTTISFLCVNYPFKTFIYVLLLSFPPNISSLTPYFLSDTIFSPSFRFNYISPESIIGITNQNSGQILCLCIGLMFLYLIIIFFCLACFDIVALHFPVVLCNLPLPLCF